MKFYKVWNCYLVASNLVLLGGDTFSFNSQGDSEMFRSKKQAVNFVIERAKAGESWVFVPELADAHIVRQLD